jgi:hypothetical protein
MFGADYVHISRLRKSGLLQLSLNISQCQLPPCHTEGQTAEAGEVGGDDDEAEDDESQCTSSREDVCSAELDG